MVEGAFFGEGCWVRGGTTVTAEDREASVSMGSGAFPTVSRGLPLGFGGCVVMSTGLTSSSFLTAVSSLFGCGLSPAGRAGVTGGWEGGPALLRSVASGIATAAPVEKNVIHFPKIARLGAVEENLL